MPHLEAANATDLRHSSLTDIGRQYNYYSNIYLTDERVLAAFKPAIRDANDVPGCTLPEGTRETIPREIDSWLVDFGASVFLKTTFEGVVCLIP